MTKWKWWHFWDSWTHRTQGDFALGQRTKFDVIRFGSFATGMRTLGPSVSTTDWRQEHA